MNWINNGKTSKLVCGSKCNCAITKCSDYVDSSRILKYRRKKKAGVLFEAEGYILLVQSRGNLWGVPKGSVELEESPLSGALRELFEETGIRRVESDICNSIVLRSNSIVYEIKESRRPPCNFGDDATGIGWVKLECLGNMLEKEHISITRDLERLIERKR